MDLREVYEDGDDALGGGGGVGGLTSVGYLIAIEYITSKYTQW